MAKDYRNEFSQEIKLRLKDVLCQSDLDMVMAVVLDSINKYELTERETAIVPYDDRNMAVIRSYVSSLIVDGKAKSTIQAYTREIKKFVSFIGNADLTEAKTFDIRNYLAQYKVRGLKNSSLENTRAIIASFFSWLLKEEYITKNPCAVISPIKQTKEIKKPFTSVELDVLRSRCKNEKERAIIEVLLSSGVRVSELCDLNVDDIDFQSKTVHIRHGKGDKERYTYIDDVACSHLIKYLTSKGIESGALFRSTSKERYTPHGVRELLTAMAKRANVENVHPHRFRRTFATTLSSRGMGLQDIQKLMGHSNINTTMVYITMNDSQVKNSYQKFTA